MCKISLLFFILFSLFTLAPLIPTTLLGKDTDKKDGGLDLTLEAISILRSDSIKEKKDSNNDLNVKDKKVDKISKQVTKPSVKIEQINVSEQKCVKRGMPRSEAIDKHALNEFKNNDNPQNEIDKSAFKLSTPMHYMVKIPANKPWTRTGVYLKENDIVKIYCKGKIMPGSFEGRYKNTSCRAEGYQFTRGKYTVLPNSNYMGAIGRISDRNAFYIGSGRNFKSYVNGPLYIGINELAKSEYTGKPIKRNSSYWRDNTGCYEADIYVYR